MSVSDLSGLQPELVDLVCSWLDIHEMCSLRLVNRSLWAKVSGRMYRAQLKDKSLKLIPRDVENFYLATMNSGPACAIKDLTVYGIAFDPPLEMTSKSNKSRIYWMLRLLTKAFKNIRKYSPDACLKTLKISVDGRYENRAGAVLRPPHFHSSSLIWKEARLAAKITLRALISSSLPVTDEMDMFYHLIGCSLELDVFFAIPWNNPSFASLKELSVSLSLPKIRGPEIFTIPDDNSISLQNDPDFEEVQGNRYLPDIRKTIAGIAPKLDTLYLHWFNLAQDGQETFKRVNRGIQYGHGLEGLPRIESCTLYGFVASEPELRRFVTSLEAESITISTCELTEGNWDGIFGYLEDKDSSVDRYALEDLQQGRGLLMHYGNRSVFYPIQVDPTYPVLSYEVPELWSRFIAREPIHETDTFQYRESAGPPIEDKHLHRWLSIRVRKYGPLNKGSWFDFCYYNNFKK